MAQLLQTSLSSRDREWMAAKGQIRHLPAGAVLSRPGDYLVSTGLISEGRFVLTLPSGHASAELTGGDLVGDLHLFDHCPATFGLQAIEPSAVLEIPSSDVAVELQREAEFSDRFYRTVAHQLAQRLQVLSDALPIEQVLPALFEIRGSLPIFGCLRDQDLCWFTKIGRVEKFRTGGTCTQQGEPSQTIDLTLTGMLTVLACGSSRPIAQILPGELVGVAQFLDQSPHAYTLQATSEALILRLPLMALRDRLQHDTGFSARFHRAIASLTADRLRQLRFPLQGVQRDYGAGNSLHDEEIYDGELCMTDLQQLSQSRLKFNWLLHQLGIKE